MCVSKYMETRVPFRHSWVVWVNVQVGSFPCKLLEGTVSALRPVLPASPCPLALPRLPSQQSGISLPPTGTLT